MLLWRPRVSSFWAKMSRGGFYDLNILVDRQKVNHLQYLTVILKAAHKLGYDTVAVNTRVDEAVLQKGTGKSRTNEIPKPLDISLASIVEGSNLDRTERRRKFRVLQRLTVAISDPAQTTKLQTSSEVKLYDILAVEPANEKVFQMTIGSLNVDLICLPMTSRLPVLLRPQHVGVALERGLFTEITYAPAMANNSARQITISNAQHIVEAFKGRNVIVASQATSPLDLRGPYDVINLCHLFGAKGPLAVQFLLANGRSLVLKAECRKSAMGAVTAFPTSWLPEEDAWKALDCKNNDKQRVAETPVNLRVTKKRRLNNGNEKKPKRRRGRKN